MPEYRVNQDAVAQAEKLIDAGKYDDETEWSDAAPSVDDGNAEIEEHGYEGYAAWHLAIDPDAVDMELARDEASYPEGQHAWLDWTDGSLKVMPWWSSFSRTGVQGRPTLATQEKGKALLDAAVRECVEYVREVRARPILGRRTPERPS